jgi:leucyl/phenylalanyl-tRNA--protein transferase
MHLTPEMMLRAYTVGLFPMAEDAVSTQLSWYDPDPRGIIPLEDFHVPTRLRRTVRKAPYTIRIDTAFAEVMQMCGPARPGGQTTWINRQIIDIFTELHRLGFAHSVEAWRDQDLVGGLYGVAIGGAFFGESMFSTATDASKIALVHLVARLKAAGFRLLDTQFVNDHLLQFGVTDIPRQEYKRRLAEAARLPTNFAIDESESDLVARLLGG